MTTILQRLRTNSVRQFDNSYETPLTHRVRARFGCDGDRTEITRFLIQLEYRMTDGWTTIVRSDHNPTAVDGHDVESEGPHIDLYRNGKKVRVQQIGPPMPAATALNRAEEHLVENFEQHVRRFEQWHNLNRSNDR